MDNQKRQTIRRFVWYKPLIYAVALYLSISLFPLLMSPILAWVNYAPMIQTISEGAELSMRLLRLEEFISFRTGIIMYGFMGLMGYAFEERDQKEVN